jgi:hypothetical protein
MKKNNPKIINNIKLSFDIFFSQSSKTHSRPERGTKTPKAEALFNQKRLGWIPIIKLVKIHVEVKKQKNPKKRFNFLEKSLNNTKRPRKKLQIAAIGIIIPKISISIKAI